MKVYETPEAQVVVMAPAAEMAAEFGDNNFPLSSMVRPQT